MFYTDRAYLLRPQYGGHVAEAKDTLRKAMVAPNDTITVGRDTIVMWGLAVQPVPEPSAIVLALFGVFGLAALSSGAGGVSVTEMVTAAATPTHRVAKT